MTSKSGISIENISFSYGGTLVFDSVNLNIPVGQMWALIGRSGVGKTTLLQVATGLFLPSAGKVNIAGRIDEALGRIKGVVFQEDSLLGWLSVKENLLFPQHRAPRSEVQAHAFDLLRAVGLAEYGDAMPSTLSVGMRKRVEFARALLADNEYLIADEPFGPLDALTRRDLWSLWQSLRKQEARTGIWSTHDPEEAIRLCDVVIPLVSGTPARLGEPVVVPSHLALLPPGVENEELSALREKLIQSLGPYGGVR